MHERLGRSSQHLACVYASANSSHEVIEAFFISAAGQAAGIMICEPEKYPAVKKRIAGTGCGPISFFDVNVGLSQVMGPDGVDAERAASYFMKVLRDAQSASGGGAIRIYGEMGDQLCRQKKYAAALQIEGLADLLLSAEPDTSILCGYSTETFGSEEGVAHFGDIFSQHDDVIRAERFVASRRPAVEVAPGLGVAGATDIASAGSKPNVYIIDDDPSVRTAVLRFLQAKEMNVLAFESAEAFLAQLPELPPGSLLVDVQLPGISGFDLLNRMAHDGICWPAVVFSGAHEEHGAAASAGLGPDRYLRKPFDPDVLLQALHLTDLKP